MLANNTTHTIRCMHLYMTEIRRYSNKRLRLKIRHLVCLCPTTLLHCCAKRTFDVSVDHIVVVYIQNLLH